MADCLICLLNQVKEVGKCIVTEAVCPPIKRNVGYWWLFDDNIQGLEDEIRSLDREKGNMDQKIEEARQRAESATSDAKNWLDEVTKILEEGRIILQSCNGLKSWKIIPRYVLGKSSKKTAEGIAKLRIEVDSIRISNPPLPPSMAPIPHQPSTEFESRRLVEEGIIESLKDDHVRMVAICGPGGVGKTTMVQRIVERVKNILFDEVVTVVVSQQIDMHKIQLEISEMLRLPLNEATTLVGRAHIICARLQDSKTKLIIFDDVWKSFDLKDIGVPLGNGSERCKIILTSRLKDVCEGIDADKVFEIKVLDDQEAWRLFSEKSGVRKDDSELCSIAEAVAAECKGLPIALVPIAKALKNKHIRTWEDSLLLLKRANPIDFPNVEEYVYTPLKLSYDFLTESEKSIFLLCCLFPEDDNIPIELLTLYSIGLGILEGIRNIHEGRNRTHRLVDRLKSIFLLIDGFNGDYVKMHDVVRDVAIFIGSKEKNVFLKSLPVLSMDSPRLDSSCDCRWMSIDISNVNAKLPVGSAFPNLRLLMTPESYHRFYRPRAENFYEDDIDFKGMEELKVFSLLRRNLGFFAPTLELVKNLKTLLLDNSDVRDISVVGKLTSLEILRIRYCQSIEELPADIGRSNGLRLLELRGCRNLKRVAEGVISSLVRLEELKIVGGFYEWGSKVNGSEERNASLLELESLPNLTWLEIDISDDNLVAQDICLSQQLVRYRINFTESNWYGLDDTNYERNICLNLPGDIAVGNWIHQLVRNTQALQITGSVSSHFNLADYVSLCNLKTICQNVSLCNLKTIDIFGCHNLLALFPTETARSLVQLQLLKIRNCGAIEQVFWKEIESNIEDEIVEFPRLTEIDISYCPKLSTKMGKCPNLQTISLDTFNVLHHLPSSCCTRTWITQLRKLSVTDCDTIEELLVDEIEDEGNRHVIFLKLEVLKLRDLPCLTTFYRGVESIKFPKLEYMHIGNLPKLNELAPMDPEPTHDDGCLHFFCNQKVEFSCLQDLTIGELQDTTNKIWCRLVPINIFCKLVKLTIYDVNGIRNLMSSSIAENLVNLDDLKIARCREMIEVVEDDKEISVTSLFPKLQWFRIIDLRKLKSFCSWKQALEFSSLWYVNINGCPGMETFTMGPLITPHNFTLKIDDEKYEVKDLNGGLRDHFTAESQRREARREKRKARREKRKEGKKKIKIKIKRKIKMGKIQNTADDR